MRKPDGTWTKGEFVMTEKQDAARSAENFWMSYPSDEAAPWGEFINDSAIFKFAEMYAAERVRAELQAYREALRIALKFMLGSLSRHQRLLIRAYQDTNFNRFSGDEIVKWAERLEKIVCRGRPTIEKLEKFGPKTKKLWGNVLSDLAEQLDHMESIANSLRCAINPEVVLLMAAAVDHMADSAEGDKK